MKNNPRSRAFFRGERLKKHTHIYRAKHKHMCCEVCGYCLPRNHAARAMDSGAIVYMDAAQPK